MALVFDLNTGRFHKETPVSQPREQTPDLPPEEPNLDLALTEVTLASTPVAEPILSDLAGVDAVSFIRCMEQKGR